MKQLVLKLMQYILKSSARRVILRFNPYVIAVTGSVGKSSTKEAVYQVLHDKFGDKVLKSHGNMNTEIGLPLTVLGFNSVPSKLAWPIVAIRAIIRSFLIKKYSKYLILEMGVDKPGDMEYLTSIVRPDIAIITSVAGAHLAYFNNLEQYQQEKLNLIKRLKSDGRVIINVDDPVLGRLAGDTIIGVSSSDKRADYYVESLSLSLQGTEFRVASVGHKIAVKSALLGEQLVYPALFAFAVGELTGIHLSEVGKSLERLKQYSGRMRLIEGKSGVLIIDDSYNANPASVKAALDFLCKVSHNKRKVLILGNMNELGKAEEEEHLAIGKYARDKCDLAIFVGPNAEIMAKGYNNDERAMIFPERKKAIKAIPALIQAEDLVLVKASQNKNYFEEITKMLMRDPAKASELLVRQGKLWMKKKR